VCVWCVVCVVCVVCGVCGVWCVGELWVVGCGLCGLCLPSILPTSNSFKENQKQNGCEEITNNRIIPLFTPLLTINSILVLL
jgi:hypothetical protein